MRTLGHVVKISKSFCFSPCIYYENNGPHDGPSFSQQTQSKNENQMFDLIFSVVFISLYFILFVFYLFIVRFILLSFYF